MTILDSLTAEPVPIQTDADGQARVGGTRVRLDTVITAFNQGCAAEEILLKYPSLKMQDIYAVITYYLWHRDQIDAYLEERRQLAETVRQESQSRFPPEGIRDRLLARRAVGP